MSGYVKGSMDISQHRRTWEGVTKATTWSIVLTVILLSAMAYFLVHLHH